MKMKDLRVIARLSQEEMGRRLAIMEGCEDSSGVFQSRISSYELGRNAMSLDVARNIVKILNDKLEEIGSEFRASLDTLEVG